MGLVLLIAIPPARAQQEMSIQDEISYPLLEKLIATAYDNYPRMKVFDTRVDIAAKEVKRTQLSYLDVLTFSYFLSPFKGGTAALNPNRLNGYQFGIFANVGTIFQKPTQIRQSRDQLRVAELQKAEYLLNLEAEVKRRYFDYAKAKVLLRAASNAVLDSKITIEDLKYRFEKGEIPFESYNRAAMDMSLQLQARIGFEGDALIAKSTLEELLGKKLEEIQ